MSWVEVLGFVVIALFASHYAWLTAPPYAGFSALCVVGFRARHQASASPLASRRDDRAVVTR